MTCSNSSAPQFISGILIAAFASTMLFAAEAAGPAAPTDPNLPPLPIEDHNIVESLPTVYPESWFLVHDAAFSHMLSGETIVFDAAEENPAKQWKGSFPIAMIGMYTQSVNRAEIYVVETYYTRGTRGDRADVVTIYDNENLSILGEVILPGEKRLTALPERYSIALIDDEKYLVVSNFTPAASVTIVDAVKREVVGEISTPGCVLVYPTGQRGWSSICSNGSVLTTTLDANGKLAKQERSAPFFDTNTAAISEHAAIIEGVAYFPSLKGLMHPINLTGNTAKVMDSWSLVSPDEAAANWRPGGVVHLDKDDLGRMYILMHPDGFDGSRQQGGAEVWVFDVKKQQRVARYELNTWGVSVAVSRGKEPLMMVTNAEMNLDIYQAKTGKFLRTISDKGMITPLEARGSR